MWCFVPFFCGCDEHSTARAHPPPTGENPAGGVRYILCDTTATAAVPAMSAETGDMLLCHARVMALAGWRPRGREAHAGARDPARWRSRRWDGDYDDEMAVGKTRSQEGRRKPKPRKLV
ncbi:hypothetical protein GUJ93_ZPchr0005g14502 [Zizania palustris]|uniref:Uncharacterized protein n=1 Tax=Zizania palustris TaxID=103762 RepID=A0A8J5VRM8_ZIZPA|nr:hypothetical protein GUJ93_ZPchr0005g14502 [Zizania palustris]